MHWRHCVKDFRTEKLYNVDEVWKYGDKYFNDYYVPDAPVTLKTFGLCSRAPEEHIINRMNERYSLHYILSGSGYINGVQFDAGDTVFCTNSTPYSLSPNRDDPCIYAWISFTGGKSEKYMEMLGLTEAFKIYRSKNSQRINEILYDMMEVDHNDIHTALYLEAKFIELLALSRPEELESNQKTAKKSADKRVNAAIQYISNNFRNPNLRLSDVAAAISTNEKYLQRIFKESMGISVYQYISKLRMDAAKNLLASSNYNINEIAEYIGYNDRRTFFEIFRKHFGVSPKQYAENAEA